VRLVHDSLRAVWQDLVDVGLLPTPCLRRPEATILGPAPTGHGLQGVRTPTGKSPSEAGKEQTGLALDLGGEPFELIAAMSLFGPLPRKPFKRPMRGAMDVRFRGKALGGKR
jgi:hypothetical protein